MEVRRNGYIDLRNGDNNNGASGVLFDGGNCLLRCVGSVVGLFFSCGGSISKMDSLCGMGRNVRVDVCSHVCIWIKFQIFCLAECFLMGER